MQKLTAGEYFRQLTYSCFKNSRGNLVYQPNYNEKPNIFFYQPMIFGVMDKNGFMNEDWVIKAEGVINKLKKNEKITDDELCKLLYEPEPCQMKPKMWKLAITFRLFDAQCKKLLEETIDNFKFNQSMPNKAYLYAYMADGNRHYNGAAIYLPELTSDRHKQPYQLEITEKWSFKASMVASDLDDDYRDFTRHIAIPLGVKDDLTGISARCDQLSQQYFDLEKTAANKQVKATEEFGSCLEKLEQTDNVARLLPVANYYDFTQRNPEIFPTINKIDNNDMSILGKQTLIMPFNFVLPLKFNYFLGIYDQFYGNKQMVFKALKKVLNQSNLFFAPSIIKLIKRALDLISKDSPQYLNETCDLLAAMVGAKFEPKLLNSLVYYDELTPLCMHNGQGNNIVSMAKLLYGDSLPISRYDLLVPGLKKWHSCYDFEEKILKIDLPGQTKTMA